MNIFTGFVQYLAQTRANLQSFRLIMIGFTSVLRIVTFLLCSLLITYWRGVDPKVFFDGFWMRDYNFTVELVNKSTMAGSEVLIDTEVIGQMPGTGSAPINVFLIQALCGIFVYNCGE